ncbi:MAG: hypothetical protein N2606_00910 [Candidatus Omnitrophica bacterium]|nr:hypothetical protein [Candidatus Omnitrophota bacterium]
MDKQKIQIIIIILGIPLMFFLFWHNLSFKNKKRKTQATVSQLQEASSGNSFFQANNKVEEVEAAVLEEQRKNAQKPWGRDPFSADPYKAGQASALRLQGISMRKDKVGFAFVSNEIVKVGDIISGYEVVEILPDKVLLRKGSQSFYLTFPEQ